MTSKRTRHAYNREARCDTNERKEAKEAMIPKHSENSIDLWLASFDNIDDSTNRWISIGLHVVPCVTNERHATTTAMAAMVGSEWSRKWDPLPSPCSNFQLNA